MAILPSLRSYLSINEYVTKGRGMVLKFFFFRAINPKFRKKPGSADEHEDFVIGDKIDVWGNNPGWDPSYVKAYRINYMGQV